MQGGACKSIARRGKERERAGQIRAGQGTIVEEKERVTKKRSDVWMARQSILK